MNALTHTALRLLTAVAAAAAVACTQPEARRKPLTRSRLIEINRMLVEKDSAIIAHYNDSLGLGLTVSSTGLWTRMHTPHDTARPAGGSVSIAYVVTRLNGDTLYTSAADGIRTFDSAQGDVETGLAEATAAMHVGDSATIVMPPYHAFGIAGDDNKIKGRCIVRYDIKIVDRR